MTTQSVPSEAPAIQENDAPSTPVKWWCNFCDFATYDQKEYLQHSCAEVLRQKGQKVEPTGQNECR